MGNLQAIQPAPKASVDFDDVLRQAKNQLHLSAMRLTRSEEAAKDLIQETVLKALLNREKKPDVPDSNQESKTISNAQRFRKPAFAPVKFAPFKLAPVKFVLLISA